MIVCICNNISDNEIKQAISLGVNTIEDLENSLGISNQCGQCYHFAKKTFYEELKNKSILNEILENKTIISIT